MNASSASCFFPTFSTFSPRTSTMDPMTRTAMMIQVTTTDSPTGIPPNTGMTKAVLEFSSSTILSAISVWLLSSLPVGGIFLCSLYSISHNYLSIITKKIISNI